MWEPIQEPSLDFYTRPLVKARGTLGPLAFTAIGACFLILNMGELNGGFFFGALTTWCGAHITWHVCRMNAIRGPYLRISQQGLNVPFFCKTAVVWDDITSLNAREFFGGVQILVHVKDIEKYRPPKNRYEHFSLKIHKILGFGLLSFPVDTFDRPVADILRAVERLGPRRLSPVALPAPDAWIFTWGRRLFLGLGAVVVLAILAADGRSFLGGMIADGYRKGDILPKDDSRAAEWYRWLAERPGLIQTKAQRQLGEMLFEGRGVPQRNVEAYHWLTRAMAGGSRSAAELRATLASRLSADQFREANLLAQEGMLKDFPEDADSDFSRYLRADSHKAIAADNSHSDQAGYTWGRASLDDALADAMRRCVEIASIPDRCRWFAIGDVLVADLPKDLIERVIHDYRQSVTLSGPSRNRN